MFKLNSWNENKKFNVLKVVNGFDRVESGCGSEIVSSACGGEVSSACGSEVVSSACGGEITIPCGSERF